MQVIEPDFDRLTDLPGADGTPRPVDIDQTVTGFRDLASLRIDELADGTAVTDGTGAEEVLLVLLAGAVSITVTGPSEATFQLDADGDWGIYLPPHHQYQLQPLAPATVAQARARSSGSAHPPRAFRPVQGVLAIDEPAQCLRLRLIALEGEADASAGLGDGSERLVHFTGPAKVAGRELPPAHTLALSPGENTHATGEGEMLTVAAFGAPATAGP